MVMIMTMTTIMMETCYKPDGILNEMAIVGATNFIALMIIVIVISATRMTTTTVITT